MNTADLLVACATCGPGAGSPLAAAANGAVLLMLGVMSVLFLGFAGMVITIVRRARAARQELPHPETNT